MMIMSFINGAGLEAMGQNLFRETTASGAPLILVPGEQGAGEIAQGEAQGQPPGLLREVGTWARLVVDEQLRRRAR